MQGGEPTTTPAAFDSKENASTSSSQDNSKIRGHPSALYSKSSSAMRLAGLQTKWQQSPQSKASLLEAKEDSEETIINKNQPVTTAFSEANSSARLTA